MARPKKSGDKNTAGKGPVGSPDNLHKRIESEQISSHIDAFEKSGGRVEKLGVTRVLQKVAPDPDAPDPDAPAPDASATHASASNAAAAKPAAPVAVTQRGRPPKAPGAK